MSLFDLDDVKSVGMFGEAGASSFLDEPEEIDPYEGMDVEERAETVLNEAQIAFRDRARAENERMMLAVDSEFWVALSFQTRAQKEQFLELAKLIHLGDKYLDGWEVAKVMGITLDRVKQPYNDSSKLDQKWIDLAM
jgi:hypothetical protein